MELKSNRWKSKPGCPARQRWQIPAESLLWASRPWCLVNPPSFVNAGQSPLTPNKATYRDAWRPPRSTWAPRVSIEAIASWRYLEPRRKKRFFPATLGSVSVGHPLKKHGRYSCFFIVVTIGAPWLPQKRTSMLPRNFYWMLEQIFQIISQRFDQFCKPHGKFFTVTSSHDGCVQEPGGKTVAHKVDLLPPKARAIANQWLYTYNHQRSFFLGRALISMHQNRNSMSSPVSWHSIDRVIRLQALKFVPKNHVFIQRGIFHHMFKFAIPW